MKTPLVLAITTERLAEGEPEERATFGCFTLTAGTMPLTEGLDHYTQGHRDGPMVAGYYIAQWLAWNWWRLRWEPPTRASGWASAHAMAAIGDGYCWPNVTIRSDGAQTTLVARPSSHDAKPFRYLANQAVVVPATAFEDAVDHFVRTILDRLRSAAVHDTNLHQLWDELLDERENPESSRYRQLEAMLGFDPDDAEGQRIRTLRSEEAWLGTKAVDEIAAEYGARHGQTITDLPGAAVLGQIAASYGAELRESDGIKLPPGRRIEPSETELPYLVGRKVAKNVRDEAGLRADCVRNKQLAELAGTVSGTLDRDETGRSFPFILRQGRGSQAAMDRVVMRSKWESGRRFDMARLICDRLVFGDAEALAPATTTGTYRQKVQRAFAAEFLVPIEALKAYHAGDYSEDKQIEAAEHFIVSQRLIESHLRNHDLIPREDEADSSDRAAA